MGKDTVHKFNDEESLSDFINGSSFVVVNFTSRESIQTNQINSTFTELSKKHPYVRFIQLDKDEMSKTFREWEVSKIPTFMFINTTDETRNHTCMNSDDLIKEVEAFSEEASGKDKWSIMKSAGNQYTQLT
ncbi:hypothetical protein IWW56_002520 [Coemansia sp. RSA 2131]|nr:hypothetical protein IWW56_002520 [Coemansia sp. RSA 2131]